MALDQATQALFKTMVEAAGPIPVWEMSAVEVRQARKSDPAIFGTPPPMFRAEDVSIPTRDGSAIPGRLLVPAEHPRALFVYLHGGGWVLGDLAGYDTLARRLAARTGAATLLVDYRLAPEHPFPVPLHDCWDALCWADEECARLVGEKVPLLVGGDSAGGNLAAVLARWTREQGGPQLAAQVLIYPVTDADFSCASYAEPENQTLLPTPFMAWFWDQYIADPAARLTPDAAPLRARDLSGLAPALVLTAQHDILRDEGQAYAAALRAAGVVVEHHDIAGQMHGFFRYTGILPGSDTAMAKIGEFVEKYCPHNLYHRSTVRDCFYPVHPRHPPAPR